MVRYLSKALSHRGGALLRGSFDLPPVQQSRLCFRRHFSSKAPSPSSASSSSSGSSSSKSDGGAESDASIFKKLDDMVRRIIVHKATPVWLPFIPGASFWVPPPRSTAAKIADLVDKATNELTEEEYLSVMSPHGWPCSYFFIPPDDSESTQQVEFDLEYEVTGNEVLELKLELLPPSDDSSKPGDEEN